jgi:CheY-like chemotaxis protein
MAQSMPQLSVLIAIDDLFFLSKIKTALESQGCIVRIASQSPSLLKMALEQVPSLVILDLGLSTLDPPAFLDTLRATAGLSRLPVLCYTNHTRVPEWEKRLKDNNVKVVPNSYISSGITDVMGLLELFKTRNDGMVGL